MSMQVAHVFVFTLLIEEAHSFESSTGNLNRWLLGPLIYLIKSVLVVSFKQSLLLWWSHVWGELNIAYKCFIKIFMTGNENVSENIQMKQLKWKVHQFLNNFHCGSHTYEKTFPYIWLLIHVIHFPPFYPWKG